MATLTDNVRPAVDIEEDIREFIRDFDPLKQSRPYFGFTVVDGVVTFKGHVGAAVAYRVLEDSIPDIEGVVKVDMTELYDDENIRLAIGKVVPSGVQVRVNYGHVVLSGRLPEGTDEDALVGKINGISGVIDVTTHFF